MHSDILQGHISGPSGVLPAFLGDSILPRISPGWPLTLTSSALICPHLPSSRTLDILHSSSSVCFSRLPHFWSPFFVCPQLASRRGVASRGGAGGGAGSPRPAHPPHDLLFVLLVAMEQCQWHAERLGWGLTCEGAKTRPGFTVINALCLSLSLSPSIVHPWWEGLLVRSNSFSCGMLLRRVHWWSLHVMSMLLGWGAARDGN